MLNKLEALNYKNFLVITISDILKIQLEDIIRRHRLPFDVDEDTGDDFDKILDWYDFVVIDEAHKFSKKNVVNFRSDPVKKRLVFVEFQVWLEKFFAVQSHFHWAQTRNPYKVCVYESRTDNSIATWAHPPLLPAFLPTSLFSTSGKLKLQKTHKLIN